MDTDPPSTSPLETPPAASPFSPEPEQPRLGIIHFMVWTACAAVYFSIVRTAQLGFAEKVPVDGLMFAWLGQGVGAGAALGGLVLFAARRYRGPRFPTQPGETLLVLLGVGVVIEFVRYLASFLMVAALTADPNSAPMPFRFDGSSQSLLLTVVAIVQGALSVFLFVLYIIAVVRTKILRWRLYFLTVIITPVLYFLAAPAAGLLGRPSVWLVLLFSGVTHLILTAVLLAVVSADAYQKLRYRWTHWLGVAVALWGGVFALIILVWTILSLDLPY